MLVQMIKNKFLWRRHGKTNENVEYGRNEGGKGIEKMEL